MGDPDAPTPTRERTDQAQPDVEPTQVEPTRVEPAVQPERVEPARSTELEQPGGLLGLLLWPLRAAISLGLQVFAAFVKGLLGAIFPALRDEPEDDEG